MLYIKFSKYVSSINFSRRRDVELLCINFILFLIQKLIEETFPLVGL